jgi:hypothetical protein
MTLITIRSSLKRHGYLTSEEMTMLQPLLWSVMPLSIPSNPAEEKLCFLALISPEDS